jgi:CheY-like chemotaxis protein
MEEAMSSAAVTDVTQRRGRVLVVDDEEALRRALQRILEHAGYEVVGAANGREAHRWLADTSSIDAIVSDLNMPEMGGLELLRAVRERDLDLPVVLVTAAPDIASAIEAIDYGAYKYIPKPVDSELLRDTVRRAVALRRMARLKREALAALGQSTVQAADRAGLEASFERALHAAWIAYQPIVRSTDGSVFGYEALLRSSEPTLPHPGAILDAAERLGRLDELGRAVRSLAAAPMQRARGAALFVNLHPRDLADETLFAPAEAVRTAVAGAARTLAAAGHIPAAAARTAAVRHVQERPASAACPGTASDPAAEPDLAGADPAGETLRADRDTAVHQAGSRGADSSVVSSFRARG